MNCDNEKFVLLLPFLMKCYVTLNGLLLYNDGWYLMKVDAVTMLIIDLKINGLGIIVFLLGLFLPPISSLLLLLLFVLLMIL